jgi:hypothetical protein
MYRIGYVMLRESREDESVRVAQCGVCPFSFSLHLAVGVRWEKNAMCHSYAACLRGMLLTVGPCWPSREFMSIQAPRATGVVRRRFELRGFISSPHIQGHKRFQVES